MSRPREGVREREAKTLSQFLNVLIFVRMRTIASNSGCGFLNDGRSQLELTTVLISIYKPANNFSRLPRTLESLFLRCCTN